MGQHAAYVLTLCLEVFEDFELVKFRVDFERQILDSIYDTEMIKPLSDKLHGLMLMHTTIVDDIAKGPQG